MPDFLPEAPPAPPKKEEVEEEEEKVEEGKVDEIEKSSIDDTKSTFLKFMDIWESDGVQGVFMKNVVYGFVFYMIGRLQMSFVLLLITIGTLTYVTAHFMELRKRQIKQDKVSRLVYMTNNGLDNDMMSMMMDELPAWVRFPEIESVRWLNRTISKLWKALRPCLDTYLCDALNPTLAYYKPEALTLLEMITFDLGSTPPQIQGIKCHEFTSNSVMIDLELRLVADSSSKIKAKVVAGPISLPVMLRNVNLIATLRIEMRCIRGSLPCFDELHISFARKPKFEFDLAAGHRTFDLAHFPIIDRAIMDTVSEVFGWYVFPSTYAIPMRATDELIPAEKDEVVGVLFVTVLGARKVTAKKSHHPSLYAETKFNGVNRKTKTTKDGEWYEDNVFKFMIKQEDIDLERSLTLKLKQKGMITGSFMIGCIHIPISHIKIGDMLEEWLQLWSNKGEKESAELHVRVDLRIIHQAADIHNFKNVDDLMISNEEMIAKKKHRDSLQRKNHASAFTEALKNAVQMLQSGTIDQEEFDHIKSVMYSEDKKTTAEAEKSFHQSPTTSPSSSPSSQKSRRHSEFSPKLASKFEHAQSQAVPSHHRKHHSPETFSHADTAPSKPPSPRRRSHFASTQSSIKIETRNRSISETNHRSKLTDQRFLELSKPKDDSNSTRESGNSTNLNIDISSKSMKNVDTSTNLNISKTSNGKTLRVTISKLTEIPVSPNKSSRRHSSPKGVKQYYAQVSFGGKTKKTQKCKSRRFEALSWAPDDGTVSFSNSTNKDNVVTIEILRKRSILSNLVLGVVRIDLSIITGSTPWSKVLPVEVDGQVSSSEMHVSVSWI